MYLPNQNKKSEYVAGAVCVAFKDKVESKDAVAAIQSLTGQFGKIEVTMHDTLGIANVKITPGQEQAFIAEITKNPLVEAAELELMMELMG